MRRFEYRVLEVSTAHWRSSEGSEEAQLNELGGEGWELVSLSAGRAYLKREAAPRTTAAALGGQARARNTTPGRRSEIARKAAQKRWNSEKGE